MGGVVYIFLVFIALVARKLYRMRQETTRAAQRLYLLYTMDQIQEIFFSGIFLVRKR